MSDSTQITDLLQQGIAAAKAGSTQEARQALLQVTELDERNELAWLWLSGVVDSLEDRRICLENVLVINPDNAYAQAGMSWLDQQQDPTPPSTQERCPGCQAPVPTSGTTCPLCGQLLIVACPACGQYLDVSETSCPECGQSLGDFHDGARYHLTLARAYCEQQRYTLAQEAAARAVAEAAGDPQVLEQVAALHEDMGNVDLAVAAYQQAIEHDSANAAIYFRLGVIYRQRAMPTEARAMLERAAAQDGDDAAILYALAELTIEQGDGTADVLSLLERVVHLDPAHVQAHLLLGDLVLDQGEGPRAIQHYERACNLAPPGSQIGREARRKLNKLRPPVPQRQAQGWGETVRRMAGLLLTPALAALTNARLVPWKISLLAWCALMVASAGAYLWVCATDVPCNPAMRAVFGKSGVNGRRQQALVGVPGVLLWTAALALILAKT